MRRRVFATAVAAAIIVAALALIPTPYWLVMPGSAVDLRERIAVDGYAPPADRYYLTDVSIAQASVLGLTARLLPGVTVIGGDSLVPRGIAPGEFARISTEEMTQSQSVAAFVAERSAGLHVPMPQRDVVVVDVLADSPARSILRSGDAVEAVNGNSVKRIEDVERAVRSVPAGKSVAVTVRRAGRTERLRVPTLGVATGPRLRIVLEELLQQPALPVPVHFQIDNVGGSSGGLMFALDIYETLRGPKGHSGASFAGTGALAPDGTVGPIQGALQKLIAAKRTGAQLFLVPRPNYAEVSGERGVHVVPVGSFREALAAVRASTF